MDARAEVEAALRRLSDSWKNRRYSDLRDGFHESAVIDMPALGRRREGRDAVVESYREFMDRSTLDDVSEEPALISVWADTAVAHYRWRLVWTSDGKQDRGSGVDVFVFARMAGEWKAVWRTMLIDPPA